MSAPDRPMPSLLADSSEEWVPSTEHCPVSVGTRLIGDRWSLLIIREIFFGINQFNELQRALPGLSRSVLATRLRYLQRIGVIFNATERPGAGGRCSSYTLTPSGHALRPVLEALGQWALTWQLPSEKDDRVNVLLLLWRLQQSVDRGELPNGKITIQFFFSDSEISSGWLRVGPDGSSACSGLAECDADLTVRTDAEVLSDLWWRRRTCEQAIAAREITFDGPVEYARRFKHWFGNRPPAPSGASG